MKKITFIALFSALSLSAFSQQAEPGTYEPAPENIRAREAFSDSKFGIFLHWGLYSMFAQGEWYLNNSNIDAREYAKAASAFYPSRFDADAWVKAFKDAGARYVCLTSRHHDGFSLWDTKQSDYDIIDATPFGRDIIKELSEACRRHGLKLHLYYSHLDWTREDYPWGKTGLGTGRDRAKGNWDSYYRFMNSQLTELLTGYGEIGAIWFDGVWDHENDATPFDWKLEEQYRLIHSLQPACLIGNNHHVNPVPGEDFQIFECDLPGENKAGFSARQSVTSLPLETCHTINGNGVWGYQVADRNYKTADDIIFSLVNAAGRGANLLFNIGPQPNGELPEVALSRLKEVGQWTRQYGETIYATRAGDVEPQAWGVTTRKGDRLFVHILQDGKVASLFLQHNNLTGTLPYIIFAMPYLRTADLSGNQLTGSIKRNEADHAAIYEGLTLKADSLQYLDISANQLTGNLSDIMPYAPALTTLKANENRISEIKPLINVATLEFDAQDLRGIFTVKYSDLCKMKEGTENTMPTVLTYINNSYADSYKTTVSTYISDTCGVNLKDKWYMQLNTNLLYGTPTPTYYNTVSDGWYNYPSGITQNAFSSVSEWKKRHRFNVVMDYEMGDVNFDTEINLSDMQKTLNTALDSTYYGRYMPFNFYAANLISTDKTINVQDVVASINLLLDLGVTPTLAKARAPQQASGTEDEEAEPEATLSIIDGKLVLSTARLVAALDLVCSDESVEWEPVMNLFSKSARATRTIFYSLFGDLLPEGETVLAELEGTITAAMLVDIDGNEIPLRIIDGEATGIDAAPDAAQQGGEAYDLQGRRVSTQQILQKGIYIIDGKKVMQ